jgi:hypothetical protein
MPKKERRREERVAPAFRVRTEVLQEEGNIHMAVFADIVNLSEGGICLRSPLKLANKDRIIIFLPRLAQQLPLEVHGLVVWTKPRTGYLYEYGMEFSGIAPEQAAKIRADLNAIMNAYFEQSSLRLED